MNLQVNLFFHLYETHITPLGIPIPAVARVSDGVGSDHEEKKIQKNLENPMIYGVFRSQGEK